MIAVIDAFDRDSVVARIAQMEHELFGRGAWSEKAVREELSAPARVYIIDVLEDDVSVPVADVSAMPQKATDVTTAEAVRQASLTKQDMMLGSRSALASQPASVAAEVWATAPALPIIRGYAGYWYDGDDAELMTIGVDAAHRRQGIANRMLQWLVNDARMRGARRMLLEVRVDNEPAMSLYRQLGFIRMGLRRRYYQPENIDAYTMSLDLRPHIVGFQTRYVDHSNADSIGSATPHCRDNANGSGITEPVAAATAISPHAMNYDTNRLATGGMQKEEER
jgi:ribosomal-protein-alanine N-acetyltransferase